MADQIVPLKPNNARLDFEVIDWRDKNGHLLARIVIAENYGEGKKYVGYADCSCNAGWSSGLVLDPFMGSGTTALIAHNLGRRWIGIELNQRYIDIAEKRLRQVREEELNKKNSLFRGPTYFSSVEQAPESDVLVG